MRRTYTIITALLIALSSVLFAVPVAAVGGDVFEGPCTDPAAQNSALCKQRGTYDNPLLGPNGLLTRVTRLLAIATAVSAVISIIISGFLYVTADGDSKRLNTAKQTLVYAIVGLAVAALAQAIVSFVLTKL